ncbi:hypothetical protein [Citrobacter sp. BDA59-3]|uniref:hypothetical protein n=1 Tax=Citrobacter sp. BDA59-3 TaxID=2781952 RepID=UPI00188002C2|nr:hypothetical protein [Citrobacter sp. BDA59-3]QOV71091.1 hypothetical protein IP582_12295 [Citrobacter sp. BDA59-3]
MLSSFFSCFAHLPQPLLMVGMGGTGETVLMAATDRMVRLASALRAARVVRVAQIQIGRENFIFRVQKSNAIPASRMQ